MKKLYFLFILFISSLSFGQVLLQDDFNYTNDDLLTNNGWSAVSGGGTNPITVGTSNGLTYAGYSGTTGLLGVIEGNAAMIDNNGEDVAKTFTATTSGDIYMSFMLNVVSPTAGYFIGLGNGGTSYTARVFTQPGSVGGTFNLGISNSSTATYGTTNFNLNQTYLVIVKYNISSQAATLWCIASGVPANEVAAGTAEVTSTGGGLSTVSSTFMRQYNAAQHQIVDGLLVAQNWPGASGCSLSLTGSSATCDAVTLAIDTYTASITFTGGGSGSYTLSASSGTVGGDNPTSVASGTITISGVTEGTNVTLTITGSCNLNNVVTAPECKPVNTLPYYEPFNYTVSNSLGLEQKWTNVNTGDNIVVSSGSLNYGGIATAGNSVSFAGAGIDCYSPFTPTTSGNLFAGFIMRIDDLTAVTDGNETYYAILTDASQSFRARLFLKKVGSQYQIGFDSAATTTNYDASLRNIGDVVYVIMGYDFSTNMLKAWINPNLATFTAATAATLSVDLSGSPITQLGGFMLRQHADNTTPSMIFDELRITATATDFALSSNSFSAIDGLKMYPNPVSGNNLYFSSTNNTEISVQIFDVLGKEVKNTKVMNNQVNIAGLNAGVYIVKITEAGKTATRKLIVK